MSEDAPVDAGAVAWPDPDWAAVTVRRMQTKLHHWAREDASRRFDDLYNLVCHPAFLVWAWERVAGNRGPGPRVSTGSPCLPSSSGSAGTTSSARSGTSCGPGRSSRSRCGGC